jgi:hypothetical protein
MKKENSVNCRMYSKGVFLKDTLEFLSKRVYKVAISKLEKVTSFPKNALYCYSVYNNLTLIALVDKFRNSHLEFYGLTKSYISIFNNKYLEITKYLRFYLDG